jgi:hypothetical protein
MLTGLATIAISEGHPAIPGPYGLLLKVRQMVCRAYLTSVSTVGQNIIFRVGPTAAGVIRSTAESHH